MTYPWAAGEVLTAADLNAYAGLVLVKKQTIGTAVSSVTVNDAFSSTFDNYRIVVTVNSCSVSSEFLYMRLGSSATSYNDTRVIAPFDSTISNVSRTAATAGSIGVMDQTYGTRLSAEIFLPFATGLTYWMSDCIFPRVTPDDAGQWNKFACSHEVAASYSSFVLIPGTGTITGGTIRVYGYNNG